MVKAYGRLKDTTLYKAIQEIANGKERPSYIRMSATIHTEKEDFQVLKLIREELKRDYISQTGEHRTIEFSIGVGDYYYRLLPFRENFEISIRVAYFYESGAPDPKRPPKVTRYKGLLYPNENPNPNNDVFTNKTLTDLNQMMPIDIRIEAQCRREEVFRVKSTFGTVMDQNSEMVIRALTSHEMKKVKVDGKSPLDAIDIDELDNKENYTDLLIPNTLLRDLPGFLQEKRSGLYKQGLGSFFQLWRDNYTWFVYPLYNPKRFDEDRRKLVIYSAPPEEFPGLDRTYREENKILYLVTTGDSVQTDGGRNSELDGTVGFRIPDANAFMHKPVEILPDKIRANRKRLMSEASNRERKDKLQYMKVSDPSSNLLYEASKILKQQFILQTCLWENSEPEKIHPGMPCRYTYYDRGEYIELKGTVALTYTVSAVTGTQETEKNMVRSTQLMLLLERPKDKTDKSLPSNVYGAKT